MSGLGCLSGSDCTSQICGANDVDAGSVDAGGDDAADATDGDVVTDGAVADAADGYAGPELCAYAICSDGVKNGDETRVDCGGTSCSACEMTVFVTSTMYDGNLGGLDGADAKCQTHADSAGLLGIYKAWLSLGSASPATRFTHNEGPYVLPNGAKIADNWDDIVDGSLDAFVDVTEIGGAPPTDASHTCVSSFSQVVAWNGTLADGTSRDKPDSECGGYTSTDGGHYWANLGLLNFANGCSGAACSSSAPLICFQQ